MVNTDTDDRAMPDSMDSPDHDQGYYPGTG